MPCIAAFVRTAVDERRSTSAMSSILSPRAASSRNRRISAGDHSRFLLLALLKDGIEKFEEAMGFTAS